MLAEKLVALGFVPLVDFVVQDNSDGNGPFLAEWLSSQPQPTPEEIEAAVIPPPSPTLAERVARLEQERLPQRVRELEGKV